MLASQALARLNEAFTASITSMRIGSAKFGAPDEVEKQKILCERLFQGYAKAKPREHDAYTAALAFLRGRELDDWQRDAIASALARPVKEVGGAIVLGAARFSELLKRYSNEATRGELWRLTWYGLLSSYFSFEPTSNQDEARRGWDSLRLFLERTWPLIDRQSDSTFVPQWVSVLRRERQVLSKNPVEKYASDYLAGDTETTEHLAEDLGIPSSSWFWHALVLGAVRSATAQADTKFRDHIPRLIELIEAKPAFRDEALEAILIRYCQCRNPVVHEQLRDYVCQPNIWKNPKLRDAGIATAWNRVAEDVWRMVLSWVNERNLKDFFDILAARNQADAGRLAFWSNYLKQISWTRLVFGAETMALQRRDKDVRNLIAREQGAYAELTANRDVDAFMMRIGKYVVVEFSKKPNAAYVYAHSALKFRLYERYYTGGTDDLKYGFYDDASLRITHLPGWETDAAYSLRRLGIEPDSAGAPTRQGTPPPRVQRVPDTHRSTGTNTDTDSTGRTRTASPASSVRRAPPGASFTMAQLEHLLRGYRGAFIDDKRDSAGGRLWVEDSRQDARLAHELTKLGFRWAKSRMAWYFPVS